MTWNGTNITNIPTFIYHDELTDEDISNKTDINGPGILVCTSVALRDISWAHPTYSSSIDLTDNTQNFLHSRLGSVSAPPIHSLLSRNPDNPIVTPRTDEPANGLWRCSESSGPVLHVGIYARVPGEFIIIEVNLIKDKTY